jgi:hypothetical protein
VKERVTNGTQGLYSTAQNTIADEIGWCTIFGVHPQFSKQQGFLLSSSVLSGL